LRKVYQTIKCILLLYDEITGRAAAQNRFRIYNSRGIPAIYKGNGIYLFLCDSDTEDIVTIEGEGYQTQKLFICGKEREAIHRIWMMPSKNNERAAQMPFLTGRAEPEQPVRLICDYSSQCRLLRALNPYDNLICFYHSQYSIMEGIKLCIKNMENGCSENILLGELYAAQENSHEYQLFCPLKYGYQIRHTMIYRIISVSADERGDFSAVFRGFEGVSENGRGCRIETEQGICYETIISQQMR